MLKVGVFSLGNVSLNQERKLSSPNANLVLFAPENAEIRLLSGKKWD
jgi:hypothetical protein